MSGLYRGKFGPRLLELLKTRRKKYLQSSSVTSVTSRAGLCSCGQVATSHGPCLHTRPYSHISPARLSLKPSALVRRRLLPEVYSVRKIGWIPAAVRSVLKIRYLLLGGAIGGGASIARQYEEWKQNLPDTDWIKEMVPSIDIDKFRTGLIQFKDNMKGKVGEVEMDPKLKEAGWEKYEEFKIWFDKRLDSANEALQEEEAAEADGESGEISVQ